MSIQPFPAFEPEPVPEPIEEPTRFTERDMLDALHARYGPGPRDDYLRYAVAEHVPSSLGWRDILRICDFVAWDCQRDLSLHGHEVKVSRSDWLRELADPYKSEAYRRYCDRWWLVVSDRAIVKPGELPTGWGLMAPVNGALRVVKGAATVAPDPRPPGFLASLMRATARTYARRGVAALPRSLR